MAGTKVLLKNELSKEFKVAEDKGVEGIETKALSASDLLNALIKKGVLTESDVL